jgi:hypothetical protein
MRAQVPDDDRQSRRRNAELRLQIEQLEADLRQAREQLHERQHAVHNAAQVLAMARVERYLAAMEVAELADQLERLQGVPADERERADPHVGMPNAVARAPLRDQKAAAFRREDD